MIISVLVTAVHLMHVMVQREPITVGPKIKIGQVAGHHHCCHLDSTDMVVSQLLQMKFCQLPEEDLRLISTSKVLLLQGPTPETPNPINEIAQLLST